MINLTIFSKGRASQLHLLLESIRENAPSLFQNIDIIYTYYNWTYRKGYEILQNQAILPNITWMKETNFREQVLESMHKLPYSCCLVDDAIIYRKVNDDEISKIYKALEDPDTLSFLLGVGKNITYCYTAKCESPYPPLTVHDGYATWNWRKVKNRSAFRCPFMVVGNVYKTDTWFKYIDGLDPNKEDNVQGKMVKCGSLANPNCLEGALQFTYQYSNRISEVTENKLAMWNQSCVVVHPMNLVQTVSKNRTCGMGVELLNRKYLSGNKMDLQSFDFSNVNSMHKEFNYKFTDADKLNYQQMQQSYYNQPTLSEKKVIGNVRWHEALPYEQYLLKANGEEPLFETTEDKVALDFGCGPGRMIRRMSKLFERADGSDISERLLGLVKERYPKSNTYVSSGANLGDVPDNEYDFIYSTICIQHIASHSIRDGILESMSKCLKPGGYVTLQMAYHKDFYDPVHAKYLENKHGTGQTNSGCDVIINEKDLEHVMMDFNEHFTEARYWLFEVTDKYANLGGHKHDGYWPSHWIFINAKGK